MTHTSTAHKRRRPRADRLQRKSVTVMGSEVAYWERNPAGRQTILVIHGFRGNHVDLTAMSRHLHDCRVLLPDLPGCGESTAMNVKHTVGNHVRFLEEFCAKTGCRSLCVCGHSFGGTLALLLAARRTTPLTRLILISPGMMTGSVSGRFCLYYYKAALFMPQWLQRQWLANPLFLSTSMDIMLKNVSDRRRAQLVDKSRRIIRLNLPVAIQTFLSFCRCNVLRHASAIRVPTLIIGGLKDNLLPLEVIEKLHRRLRRSTLVVLPEDGHLSPMEEPRRVAMVIMRFLLTHMPAHRQPAMRKQPARVTRNVPVGRQTIAA